MRNQLNPPRINGKGRREREGSKREGEGSSSIHPALRNLRGGVLKESQLLTADVKGSIVIG